MGQIIHLRDPESTPCIKIAGEIDEEFSTSKDKVLQEAETSEFHSALQECQHGQACISPSLRTSTCSNEFKTLWYRHRPPSEMALRTSHCAASELIGELNGDPFFAEVEDVPLDPHQFGGLWYQIQRGAQVTQLKPWDSTTSESTLFWTRRQRTAMTIGIRTWEFCPTACPPSNSMAFSWLMESSALCEADPVCD